MPSWPTLPAFPGANFLDHFDSTLNARWTAVTSSTGTVTITDSYLSCTSPVSTAAFVYYNTKLDKTKSQLWMACVSGSAASAPEGNMLMMLMNGASAPTADTNTNQNAKTLVRRVLDVTNTSMQDEYFSSGGVRTWWNPATPAFQTSAADTVPDARADDYYVVGLEIDGVNSRWRMLGLGQSFATAGTYEFDQGWRLFSLTDWVTWANTRSSSDIWLVLGQPFTNGLGALEMRIEWVRYAEAPAGNSVIDAWVADKSSFATENHRIRHLYSYDGLSFVPEDRTSWALDLGAGGQPDSTALQNPRAVSDGAATDYMFYAGYDGTNWRICVASATKTRPQNGTWTKYGSNPIIPLGAGGSDDEVRTDRPAVVCDLSEPDTTKRWKMIYAGEKVSDGKIRLLYATAPTPLGTWTKQGTVVDVGGGGAKDEKECTFPAIVRYQDQWEVWYQGTDTGNLSYLLRAYGASLGSLTKDTTDYTSSLPAASQSLTANLTAAPGRTVTVGSTTGFVKDASVVLSQSSSLDDYSYSQIRKIVSGTVLELYSGVTGFTTTYPAKIRQTDSSRNRSPRQIVRVGSEWWFYETLWEPFLFTADTTYGGGVEETHLWTHSGAGPADAVAAIQYQPSPVNWRGFNNDERSAENITLLAEAFLGEDTTRPFEPIPFMSNQRI